MRKTQLVALLGLVTAALAPVVASAQAVTDLSTVTAAGVTQIGAISGISAQYAVPLFSLTVVGVGIAIAMKYIKKGKGAA